MKKHKVVTAIVMAGVVAAGLAACSTSGDDGGGPTKLTVVGWKGEGTNVADLPALNTAFEKAHPDIKLDYTYVDNSNYVSYNNPRLAGGTAADVIMVDHAKMVDWAAQGYLADLSDQSWVKRQDPALKSAAALDGKTYQVISESTAFGLFVNLDMLKAAGVAEPPTDWPGFVDTLQKLKSNSQNGLIVSEKNQWVGAQLAYLLAANELPTDWPEHYDAGKASFDPDWNPVVTKFKELFSKGLVDPALSLGLDENVDGTPQFTAGKWAFMPQGAWAVSTVQKDASFNWAFIPFPGGDAGSKAKTFTYIGTGWAENASTKHDKAAKEYIDFMSQPKNALRYITADSAFSTFTDVKSPEVTGASAVSEAAADGRMLPNVAGNLTAQDADKQISAAIDALFVDPSKSASDITKLMDQTVKATKS